MGGDGTFSQCMNGLIQRKVTESGKNLEDKEVEVTAPEINLGYLPGGMYSCIVFI